MSFINKLSIRKKLLLIILSVVFVAVAVGYAAGMIREYNAVKEDLKKEALLNARLVGEYCLTPLDFGYKDEAKANLAKLSLVPDIHNGYVYDSDGNLFAAYTKHKKMPAPPIPDTNVYSKFEGEWLHVFRKIRHNDVTIGTIYLRVSTGKLSASLKHNIMQGLLIVFGVMIIAYVLAAAMQRIISGPIVKLADFARRISREGDYTARISKSASDETGDLYDSFNNMLNQIESRDSELRENEENLRTTLNSIGDAVIATDLKGHIIRMNPIAEKLTGWKYEDAKARPISDVFNIIHANTGEKAENPVNEVLSTGEIVGLANHIKLISSTGDEYQIADSAAPIRDSDGNTTGVVMVFRDVTEEYRIREKIRRNEEEFQKMLRAIPDMVSIHDKEMNILYSNWQGFASVPTDKRKIGTKCFDTYRGYEDICPDCKAKEVIITKEPFEEEVKLPDDSWFDIRVIPIINEDGSCDKFVEWVRDITENKRAEKALEQSEKRFQIAVEGTREGLWDWNLITNEAYHSDQFARMLGYEPEELPYTSEAWSILIHPDDKEAAFRTVDAYLKGDLNYYESTFRMRTKDGNYRWITGRGKCIYDENGRPVRFVGFNTDVTARKLAEEALRESESRFRGMADMLPEAIFECNKELYITYANRKAFDLFGYEEEEMANGIYGLAIIAPEDRERALQGLEKRIKGEVSGAKEYQGIRKDGSRFPLLLHINATIKNQEITGFRGICIDITERKKTEEELQKISKLESLGILAGGIAHNFKNLLTAMSMSAELARRKPEKAEKYLNKISKSIEQASALASKFQTFSHGGAPLLEPTRINDIILETSEMAVAGSASEVKTDLDSDLPPVSADSGQIHEVFTNLFINAAQAMPNGGNIYVRSRLVTLADNEIWNISAGDYLKISVEDEGVGIPESELSEIFTPFYTTKDIGNGLGLTTVYQIIKNHNGAITVESNAGVGTVFTVFLPVVPPDRVESEPDGKSDFTPEKNIKVLLIDDDRNITENMAELSEYIDKVDLIAHNDPAKGINTFSRNMGNTPFDIVILDLSLKGYRTGGLEVLKELKYIDSEIKVIVFSGHSTKPVVAHYKDYGFNARLEKPCSKQQLENAIYKLIDK